MVAVVRHTPIKSRMYSDVQLRNSVLHCTILYAVADTDTHRETKKRPRKHALDTDTPQSFISLFYSTAVRRVGRAFRAQQRLHDVATDPEL